MARRRGIVSNRARWMNRRQTAASRRGDSSQKSVLVLADLCWSVFPGSLHAGSASLRPDRACGLCFAQVSADGLPCNEVRIACDRIAGNLDELRRSEEHTSELQSLMRISYAVFCLKKKTTQETTQEILLSSKNTHNTPQTPKMQAYLT